MLHHSIYRAKKENSSWITFIHGAGGSSAIWFKQIRFFSKHFNLLLIDLRGHGASKDLIQNPFKTQYSFESIADDIFEVMDHVQIEKSHFVGNYSYPSVGRNATQSCGQDDYGRCYIGVKS
jgi:pimeloyl-ACP methyl ester carboxylesterase